jgi:hypothetical protein
MYADDNTFFTIFTSFETLRIMFSTALSSFSLHIIFFWIYRILLKNAHKDKIIVCEFVYQYDGSEQLHKFC